MKMKSINTSVLGFIALVLLSLTSIVFIEFNRDIFLQNDTSLIMGLFEEDQIVENTFIQGVGNILKSFILAF